MKKNQLMLLTFLTIAAIVAIVGGGCSVGPNYQSPKTGAWTKWSQALAGGETNTPASLTAWWTTFNDPELNSLVERAVQSNLDLRIAQARVVEARAQAGIASADLWPSAGGSASYSRVETSHRQPVLGSLPVPSSVPFENNVYQAGFDASWELDVFGGKRRALESARAEVAASEYGRRGTLMTLLGDVARNYVDVRGYQRRLAITADNINAQEEALAITRNRFTNGLTSDLDVEQASTLLASTRAEMPALESSLEISIHRMGVLLGEQPSALISELTNVAPIPATPSRVPVGLPSDLLLRRPDVQRAERQLAAATANIGVATAELFPKFSLTGVAGFESISASDWFTAGSRFWSIGPTVQWRIFEAGRIRSNIKVQNARQQQALAAYEQTALSAFEDVENALVSYAKEQVRRHSLEDAVTSSRSSLVLAQKLYANGLTDFLNVLEAERSVYQAQDQLVQSDRNLSVDLIALFKSLGGGWQSFEHNTLAENGTGSR